jgi:hypothetical protein
MCFERALSSTILRYEHLAVGLELHKPGTRSWIALDEIDLRAHVEWCDFTDAPVDLHAETLRLASCELDVPVMSCADKPGWRMKVLYQKQSPSIEVLLIFSHAYIDAGSALLIHRDILHGLCEHAGSALEQKRQGHILVLPKDFASPLSPPPEALVDFPVDESLMQQLVQAEAEARTGPYPQTPTQAHWSPIIKQPIATRYRTIEVPNSGVQMLLAACRSNGVSMTSLLHALALLSLAPLTAATVANAFSSMTAIDIRRFLPSRGDAHPQFDAADALGNYVTILGHAFDQALVAEVRAARCTGKPQMHLIWSIAKSVRQEILAKLEQGTRNDMIGISQSVEDWTAQLQMDMQRPRRASWVITNLGIFDGTPPGHASPSCGDARPGMWSISRANFALSANVVSAALGIAIVTIRQGELALACSWQDDAVELSVGEGFVANLTRLLQEVIASGSHDI